MAAEPGAASWDGWAEGLRQELEAAGGTLPWTELRDALVRRYRRAKRKAGAGTEGAAVAEDDIFLGALAVSSVPLEYLSREDRFVRLPADAAKRGRGGASLEPSSEKPQKRRRCDATADNSTDGEEEAEKADAEEVKFKAYVGGLPFEANAAAVRSHFESCGEIVYVDILRTQKGKSRGIAFVTFANDAGFQAALKMDGSPYGSRDIKVSNATGVGKKTRPKIEGKGKGKSNGKGEAKGKGKSKGKDGEAGKGKGKVRNREFEVFVGGLPYFKAVDEIRKDFEQLGENDRFHMPAGEEEGSHTGLAFINYLTQEGMDKALAFHETDYGGVTIRVLRADKSAKGKSKGKGGGDDAGDVSRDKSTD